MKVTNHGLDQVRYVSQLLRCESNSILLSLPTKELDLPVSELEKKRPNHVADALNSPEISPESNVPQRILRSLPMPLNSGIRRSMKIFQLPD
ncbi:hypothetical protein NPIL_662811 [Nephila pilipes]|uniref:Uncharacterized protein n=1 Tax=Nephila pilipes TaxID=299642 RepID=A0A8X6QI58_NEPPI|nr:hypothetical protein NPIL_662811 [Nephila pilipes]